MKKNVCLKARKRELKKKRTDIIFTSVHGFPVHDATKKQPSRCFGHQKVTQGCNVARDLIHSKVDSLVKEAHTKNRQ
jgi:hypothetical protein